MVAFGEAWTARLLNISTSLKNKSPGA